MSEPQLTLKNFDKEVLMSKEPVLVDFWAPWCSPCQMMLPVIEELSKTNKNKSVKITKVNVDENSELAGQYNIVSIPAFVLFKNGKVLEQLQGVVTKDKLQKLINKYL